MSGDAFQRQPLDIASYDWFDLGVVDINGDDALDIYTVNHSAAQSFLINEGDGKFDSATMSDAFSQDRQFAQLEDNYQAPDTTVPGVYLYRNRRWLTIQANDVPADQGVTGKLQFPWKMVLDAERSDAEAVVSLDTSDANSVLVFRLEADQRLVLKGAQDIIELPHVIELEEFVDLGKVFVGHGLRNPVRHAFTLMWRDRHGLSWTDINNDGVSDVFMSRGGVKGQLANINATIVDELFVSSGLTEWTDIIDQTGMEKHGCPARQTHWVDANSDGALDIHIVCSRIEPRFPDQLWVREKGLTFSNAAAGTGLDNPDVSVGVWLDMDADADMDYIASQADGIHVYSNDHSVFKKRKIDESTAGPIAKIALGDYDNDRDIDAFAVGRRYAVLLRNDNGKWSSVDPQSIGLPRAAVTANWADYDNDGDLDVHTLPGGLFVQDSSGKFHATGEMAYTGDGTLLTEATCSWFDANVDGALDVVCGVARFPHKLIRIWQKLKDKNSRVIERAVEYYQAKAPITTTSGIAEHSAVIEQTSMESDTRNAPEPAPLWLSVDLVGQPGNPDAIGAMIMLQTDDSTQVRVVGQSEGAHYSQGHYRSYFGLPPSFNTLSVTVRWPDGSLEQYGKTDVNRHINLRQGD